MSRSSFFPSSFSSSFLSAARCRNAWPKAGHPGEQGVCEDDSRSALLEQKSPWEEERDEAGGQVGAMLQRISVLL